MASGTRACIENATINCEYFAATIIRGTAREGCVKILRAHIAVSQVCLVLFRTTVYRAVQKNHTNLDTHSYQNWAGYIK